MSNLRQHHRCRSPSPRTRRDRSIAGDVNTTNVPLALLTISPGVSFPPLLRFHSILFPCVLQSITDCSPSLPSFFLPISNSTFLFFHSSFDLPTSLSRFLFPLLSLFSFDFFSSSSLSRCTPFLSSVLTARWSFVLGRKKIAAEIYAARVAYFSNTRDRTDERAGGRVGGWTICGLKKIVREKSECSYQSAMQTCGFASVMPGKREREKRKRQCEKTRMYGVSISEGRRKRSRVRF